MARLISGLDAFPQGQPAPVLTFGNFDGVHLGHRALAAHVIAAAKARNGTSVLLTFRPLPAKILHPDRAPALITGYEEKLALLAGTGVDLVWEVPFDRDFSDWSAEAFVRALLVERAGVAHVVLGPDAQFGKGRAGNRALLDRLGPELGFTVESVAPLRLGEHVASSTLLRRTIAQDGDVVLARALLGRPFTLTGDVVRGHQRGRLLGFPTANVRPLGELLPRFGVYACVARRVTGEAHWAVVNVGKKPTFGPDDPPTVEAYLLDFTGDLYGERLSLELTDHVRDERRFDSLDALKAQIADDVFRTRALLRARA